MSWLNTPIPLYQLLIMVTVYVIYKELIKLLVKLTYKRLRNERNARRALLAEPADESPEHPEAPQVPRPVELDDQGPDADTGNRPGQPCGDRAVH